MFCDLVPTSHVLPSLAVVATLVPWQLFRAGRDVQCARLVGGAMRAFSDYYGATVPLKLARRRPGPPAPVAICSGWGQLMARRVT